MSRPIKKGLFVHAGLLKKIEEMNQNGDKKVIKTWSRSLTILPQMISHTIVVHDERKHIPVYVTEDMVGHKLGGFTLIRTFRGHIRSKKASKRK